MHEDMMPHDDSTQDKGQTFDLMKQTLMKVIDDMTQMESDSYLPEGHPKKMVAIKAEVKPEDEAPEMPDDESGEGLDEMLGTADQADEEGTLPDEKGSDLPPEILAAVKKKKELGQ